MEEAAMGMMDPKWDLIDPNPEIHALFIHFDSLYFESQLSAVEIEWSSRMTSCAGICYFRPKNGHCVIRLSEPLLKLRPRRDLIETLLHEMIHAYLFVTNNNTDRDDHGPKFLQHMRRINAATGANVTVYHTFNEEVNSYKVHVWKCGGTCSKLHPYYGIVRRAMNRPPGKYDSWWSRHESTCGGTFLKIAGPKTRAEEKAKKREAKQHDSSLVPGTLDSGLKKTVKENIKNYFPVINGNAANTESQLSDADLHNAEGAAKGDFMWPGTGRRLGGSGLLPGRKTTSASATVTSGALLAEQRDNVGATEASHASVYDAGNWNTAKNQTSTSQLGGKGAFNPRFQVGGGDCAPFLGFGAATITPSLSMASLSGVSELMSNFAEGGECAQIAATDLDCIEREIALSLRNREHVFQMSELDHARLLRRGKSLPGECYEPILPRIDANHSERVDCPICLAKLPLPMINDHLDEHCGLTGTASAATTTDIGRKCTVCRIYLPGSMIEEHQQLCLKGVLFQPQPPGTNGTGGFGGVGITQLADEETESSDDEGPIVVNIIPGNAGRLVECPVCMRQVLEKNINEHLDECAV